MLELILPYPFVSGNHYKTHTRGGHVYITKKGEAYRKAVKAAVLGAMSRKPYLLNILPISKKVDVTVTMHPPDRRKRDKDNAEKVLYDALTLAGVWVDDSLIGRKVFEEWGDPIRGGVAVVQITASGG